MKRKFWTTEEDAIMREYYPSGDFIALMSMLPGRTEVSIRLKAQKLGVASEVNRIRAGRRGFVRDGVGYIRLTQGKIAAVDPEDLAWLLQWNWSYSGSNGYARRGVRTPEGKTKNIYMHKEILKVPDGMEVDHVDRDRLNNRRENLRSATSCQNKMNMVMPNKVSGYRGVSWNGRDRVWFVRISINGKAKNIGSFRDKVVAARAYDRAARQHHGEFAVLNFPED